MENHHHHFGHHHHENEHHHEAEHHHRRDDSPRRGDLSEGDPGQYYTHTATVETFPDTTVDFDHARSEERKHKKEEHHAELGALAPGAFAVVRKLSSMDMDVFDEDLEISLL